MQIMPNYRKADSKLTQLLMQLRVTNAPESPLLIKIMWLMVMPRRAGRMEMRLNGHSHPESRETLLLAQGRLVSDTDRPASTGFALPPLTQ